MAELGKYKIPMDANLAGADDAKCRGAGYNGLQADFETACREFRSKLKSETHYTIVFGYSGYVSKGSNEAWQKSGNTTFAAITERRFFGWGLGWEINQIKKSSRNIERMTSVLGDSDVANLLAEYGLSYRTNNKGLYYLCPRNIDYVSDVKTLDFDSEYTSQSSDGSSGDNTASIASTAYFFANQFNAVIDSAESNRLMGIRALANDEPLWNYVKKAVNASLRACSSDPDGNFIAWYPDYFGKYGVTAHTHISLDELQDLTITQSDKEFYSHVFCPGVDINGKNIEMWFTQAVVAIESDDAALADSAQALKGSSNPSDQVADILYKMIYIPDGDEWKYSPKELYRRYGARPAKTQSLPNFARGTLIEDRRQTNSDNPDYILPYLYALYEFMYHWAQQYQAKIQVTFMPEVMPGSRIRVDLPSGKYIEFYVQTVTHNMSYTSGFTTQLGCICPVGNLVSGMVKG